MYDLLFCLFYATGATNEANFVKTDWFGCDGLLGIQKDAGKGRTGKPQLVQFQSVQISLNKGFANMPNCLKSGFLTDFLPHFMSFSNKLD